jgi:hypothetical protein
MENINNKLIKNKQDTLLFSTSLIFEQNIDKLWLFLRDLNNEIKIVDYLENLKYIKGDNTWTIGNSWKINWVGLTPLKLKCISIISNKDKKIIKWKGKGDIGIKYYRTLYLYRITENQKTLVKCVVCQTEKQNELNDYKSTRNYFLNLEYKILLEKSKYLNNFNEDITIYESCIIKRNYLKVWEFLLDLKKMYKIADSTCDVLYNNSNLKEGSFIKYYLDDIKMNVFMRIVQMKRTQKRKTWTIRLEVIRSKQQNLPIFIEYKITIIDNEKTQLSLLHKFSFNSSQDIVNKYKIKIKEGIKKFKKYIEEQNEKEIASNKEIDN